MYRWKVDAPSSTAGDGDDGEEEEEEEEVEEEDAREWTKGATAIGAAEVEMTVAA